MCKNESGSGREPAGGASAGNQTNDDAQRMRAALRSLKMRKSSWAEKSKTASLAEQPSRASGLPVESPVRSETAGTATSSALPPTGPTRDTRHRTNRPSASSSPEAEIDEPQPSSEPVLRTRTPDQSSTSTPDKTPSADVKPRSNSVSEGVTPASANKVSQRRARLASLSTKIKQTSPQDQNKPPNKTPTSTAKVDKNLSQGASSVRSSITNLSSVLNQEADESWLLQRQVEVELSLRTKICSNEDILKLTSSFEKIARFFDELRNISESLNIPSGVIFQELLSRLSESNVDFDGQGGVGDIPMHQAKVIDRRQTLVQFGNIEEQVGAEKLDELLQPVQALRTLLRVKVEDANDLCMAEEAAKTAAHFMVGLSNYAAHKELTQLQALQALRDF